MRHIPNILSGARIVMVPFFIAAMLEDNTLVAGILLLVSALTDFLDGFLARRFKWISQLGKILDPIADKLTHAAVSVMLLLRLPQYWPLFAVLLGKDIVILLFGAVLMKKGVKIEGARWFGKVSTVVFFVAMLLVILFPGLPAMAVTVLITLAVICAVIAAVLYVPEFLRYRKSVTSKNEAS